MLESFQPKEVFYYFEEICKIPHGSGNTKAISDYCKNFAIQHKLSYVQDEHGNLILTKKAVPGREEEHGVILQGHLDMVAVKEETSDHDFERDGLNLCVKDDVIFAEGTSLGGDDGIAVAYALAILASDHISHPHLEVVLTVDEEIGLLGANAIDLSNLQGKYLINLDSEEEGVLLTSCAGGLRGDCELPISRHSWEGIFYEIQLLGMKGGHSGDAIDKERANAIWLAGRLLCALYEETPFSIASFDGGEKDNAIPREVRIKMVVSKQDAPVFESILKREQIIYQAEYANSDPGIRIQVKNQEEMTGAALDSTSMAKVLFLLRNLPNGIQHMSTDIAGLVETSLNLGIAHLNEETFSLTASVRSSVRSRKYEVSDRLRMMTEFWGGSYRTFGDYPEWAYRKESKLREVMKEAYVALFHTEPKMKAIHAGLECGILLEKRPDLDAVSMGPNMKDIHTPKEQLSISSAGRMWEYLIEILRRIS